jgi:hypothetical protein
MPSALPEHRHDVDDVVDDGLRDGLRRGRGNPRADDVVRVEHGLGARDLVDAVAVLAPGWTVAVGMPPALSHSAPP